MAKKTSFKDSTPFMLVNKFYQELKLTTSCQTTAYKRLAMKRNKEGKPLNSNGCKGKQISQRLFPKMEVGHQLPLALPVCVSNMASYIVCCSTREGLPVFISKSSTAKPIPIALLGSLNMVHTFTKTQQVTTLNCKTPNDRITWKEYESVILIAVTPRNLSTDYHIIELLDTVYNSMLLLVGEQDIVSAKNVEKLKRDIRCCFSVIDRLRLNHFEVNPDLALIGDVTQAADWILSNEATNLNTVLESFAEFADTSYACLYCNYKIVTATKDWLNLREKILVIISFYLSASNPAATCRDVPFYLSNSQAPHRLVVIHLVNGINVCLLCGSTPTLTQLTKEISRYWNDAYQTLAAVLEIGRKCYPTTIQLDLNILGFILVNKVERRSLCSVHPQDSNTNDEEIKPNQRLSILRRFYTKTTANLFIGKINSETDGEDSWLESRFSEPCLETYTCCTNHKLYAKQNSTYQIFILFNNKIPTYCLRSVSGKVLDSLTKSKHLKF